MALSEIPSPRRGEIASRLARRPATGAVAPMELSRLKAGALYRQLTDALEQAIAGGELAPGARLLPERRLADQLGVSRNTVMNAYRELEARGLVRGQVGRGTYVCGAASVSEMPAAWRDKLAGTNPLDPQVERLTMAAQSPDSVSFAIGLPAIDCFPVEEFGRLLESVIRRDPARVLGHGPVEGQGELRTAIGRRSGVPADQILILSGAQQGLDLIAKCLLEPGDAVVVDRPGCRIAIQTFGAAGARILGWDFARADVGELEDLFLRYRPKLVYTNPTYQNPTGRTLSLDQRRDVIEVAGRYRVPIVEDDPYRELYFGSPPPPSLYALATDSSVIHVSTFSKNVAPGLRLGWLAAPPVLRDRLARIKQRTDSHSPNHIQLAFAELIRSGGFDAHLGRLRAEHSRRLDVLLGALARDLPARTLSYSRPEGGLYLWCQIGSRTASRWLLDQGIEQGVVFMNGELCYVDGAGSGELRLCFTGVPPDKIRLGVRRLATVLAADREQVAPHPDRLMPVV